MVGGGGTIVSIYVLIGFTFGLIVGYVLVARRHRPKFHALAEFWVLLESDRLPEQSQIMDKMLNGNPFRNAIGPSEALLFSDIRLHIGLVKKSQNPQIFRPDFYGQIANEPAIKAALANAQAFVKLRFSSDDPLKDLRHLQFLSHAVIAVGDLGDGILIYDPVVERLWTPGEFRSQLEVHQGDATGVDLQTDVEWRVEDEGGTARTRGLGKVGAPDIVSPTLNTDQRLLIDHILRLAATTLWVTPERREFEVEAYDDRFLIKLGPGRTNPVPIRIHRIQDR